MAYTKAPKKNAHQKVLDSILEQLDKGTIPWHKPWQVMGDSLVITRGTCGKAYRGINVLVLWLTGKTGPWFTYKQVKAMGGYVKKGEKGTGIVFWTLRKTINKTTKQEEAFPFMRFYKVFSLCQTEGIPHENMPAWYRKRQKAIEEAQDPSKTFNPIEQADKVWSGFNAKPTVTHGQTGAWYRPLEDTIGMPDRLAFDNEPEYYSTLFHEGVHSTSHKSRVGRDLKPFALDEHSYSKEELVAEIGSAFLCAHAGIDCEKTLANSAAYIANWRKKLTDDPKLIVQAASQAQKAVDHILGVQFDRKPEDKGQD